MTNRNYDVRKTKYFILLIDKRIENCCAAFLAKSIDMRYEKLLSFFVQTKAYEKKNYIKYTLNWSSDGTISGKSFIDNLICNINDQSLITEMPMVHEEAHLVVYNKWGVLPLFWSEGLSEYAVLKYKNKLDSYLTELIISNIVDLDEKKVIDLFCYYSDDMFNYLRRSGKIYSLSACCLFDFIITHYGINLVNDYALFLQQGRHREFEQAFKKSEIFYNWKEYIEQSQ